MSVISECALEEVEKVKALHGFDVINGNGRRINLDGIQLIEIQGFNIDMPEKPKIMSITCQLNLSSYGGVWRTHSTVTYSAPIPADWSHETGVYVLSEYIKRGVFDIEVKDSRVVKAKEPYYQPVGGWNQYVGALTPDTVDQVVRHKLLGNLPSKKGFDNSLVEEINDIIRTRLFNKVLNQLGSHPTSVALTREAINGMGLPIQGQTSCLPSKSNYEFMTTKSLSCQDPLVDHDDSPYLQIVVSSVLEYEAGYMIYIDTFYKAMYPYATPKPTDDAHILQALKTARFDTKVVKVSFGINNPAIDQGDHPDAINNYKTLSAAFDVDEAARIIQNLLVRPEDSENEALYGAIKDIIEKSERYFCNEIKHGGLRCLEFS